MAKVKLSACLVVCAALAIAAAGCGGDDDKSGNAGANNGATLVAGATSATGTAGESDEKKDGKTGSSDEGKSGSKDSSDDAEKKATPPKRVIAKPKTNIDKVKPVVKVKIGMTKKDLSRFAKPFSIRRPNNPPGALECWFYRNNAGTITMVCFKGDKVTAVQTFERRERANK